jgi:hypothetical protein
MLRDLHNQLFCHDYSSMIYHHIFVEEMLECIRRDGADAQRFLLLPSGEVMIWLIADRLSRLAPEWFDDAFVEEFERLNGTPSIICIETNRERDFERQSILGHELFHMVVKTSGTTFDEVAKAPDVKGLLLGPDDAPKVLPKRIEELFCDYGAAWFYGPVVMQAFAEELSFYPVAGGAAHPDNDLRAAFLLESLPGLKDHRGYEALKRYFLLRKLAKSAAKEKTAFKILREAFDEVLRKLKLKAYSHVERRDEIYASFVKNIPFVANDIRIFINNLPEKCDAVTGSRFDDLVSESLRKISLLRQIQGFVREPEALFALPGALLAQKSAK